MNSVFNEQILADKLSKLNSTQQCIETLSHWCIFHRKKAELVVQTWDKQFRNSAKDQKTPFLYLANDILQNSKRNGNEFVEEFWKVLPEALKDVVESGDEHAKSVVSRLVGIWEERRVFGSRAKGLKDLLLGSEPPPALELSRKRSRSVKIVKRDARSIKIKLSVGGTAEKILSAFHTVLSEHPDEDIDLTKCQAAVRRVEKMEKDVSSACSRVEDPRRLTLADELKQEEEVLKKCVDNLKSFESNRAVLVTQLKEALQEQESELENVRTQLQVAQAQMAEAANMRRRLNNEAVLESSYPATNSAQLQANSNGSAEGTKRSTAAKLADKLAASTYSQQIMTSVLSTFAAQEAKNAGLSAITNPSNFQPQAPEKLKFENPMSASVNPTYIPVQQHQAVMLQQPQMQSQSAAHQPQYNLYTGGQQYLQHPGSVMIGVPYTYSTLPPPPPPQMINLARPAPMLQQQQIALMQQQPPPPAPPPPSMGMPQQQQQPLNQQPAPLTLQQPAPPSYRPLQSPGMTFYPHQSQ